MREIKILRKRKRNLFEKGKEAYKNEGKQQKENNP